MQKYLKFDVYGVKDNEIFSSIYRVDRDRLYDSFLDFEEEADWEDLISFVDGCIYEEQHSSSMYSDDEFLEALKKFREDVVDGYIPYYVEVLHKSVS
jgi:predicted ester cyclase